MNFKTDGSMEEKEYPNDYTIDGSNRRPIIVIMHDESIFSANNGKKQAWIWDGDAILRFKNKEKGIMVSDFLLLFSWLNLHTLTEEHQSKLEISRVPSEAVVYFEYGQEERYWERTHLLSQVKDQALLIATALYPGYQFLFLFDNATSHAIYSENTLRVSKINKGTGGQQLFLRNEWFEKDEHYHSQPMSFFKQDSLIENGFTIQKKVQMILQERDLWPIRGLNLVCSMPKCPTYHLMAKCKDCIKGSWCTFCMKKKINSNKCTPKHACNKCCWRKERCQCVAKKYCIWCTGCMGKKCSDCEELSPKCTSNSEKNSLCYYFKNQLTKINFRLLCKAITFDKAGFWDSEMCHWGIGCREWRWLPSPHTLLS